MGVIAQNNVHVHESVHISFDAKPLRHYSRFSEKIFWMPPGLTNIAVARSPSTADAEGRHWWMQWIETQPTQNKLLSLWCFDLLSTAIKEKNIFSIGYLGYFFCECVCVCLRVLQNINNHHAGEAHNIQRWLVE